MVWALMAKELRLLMPAWISALLLAAAGYVVIWPAMSYTQLHGTWHYDAYNLSTAACYTLVLSSLLVACGGVTRARERHERWADFAEILPISRARSVSVRLIACAGLFGLIWMGHIAVALGGELWFHGTVRGLPPTTSPQELQTRAYYLAWANGWTLPLAYLSGCLSLALFGITWAVGSFGRSPALIAGIALGVVGVGVASVALIQNSRQSYEVPAIQSFLLCVAVIGVIGIVGGTIHAVRRVEP